MSKLLQPWVDAALHAQDSLRKDIEIRLLGGQINALPIIDDWYCEHDYVNVGFTSFTLVCKKCNKEQART